MLIKRDRRRRIQLLVCELSEIVEGLDLEPLQKRFVHSRWLATLVFYEKKATYNQRLYYVLRLLTIAGGVTTAAIVGLSVRTSTMDSVLGWTAFGISLIVGLVSGAGGVLPLRRALALLSAYKRRAEGAGVAILRVGQRVRLSDIAP